MYPGSFAGHLVSIPDPEIQYTTCQTALVSVRQQDQILSQTIIENIDCNGQSFELLFDYMNLTIPVQLIFETCNPDDQFNRDNPITVSQLILDDLFTVPHLLETGILKDNNQDNQAGNVLWETGQLVYTFNLPLISGCRLA
jgi:hypothetical protein